MYSEYYYFKQEQFAAVSVGNLTVSWMGGTGSAE